MSGSGAGYPRSRREFAAARNLIPGGVTAARRPTSFSDVADWPIYTERVDGCFVWDVDGNRYIDYLCAFGPIVLGYRNRRVNEAAIREIRRGFIANLSFTIQNRLAERLIELMPSAERVLFTKTGSDACTLAVRLARGYTGRDRVVRWGYHGWHDWCLGRKGAGEVLGQRRGPYLAAAGVPDQVAELTDSFVYGDLGSLEQALDRHRGEVACIILQPFEFELPPEGFLQGVRALADRHGAVLVFDEIRTWPRVHLGGAQQYLGVTPDLTAISKALANGYPISALVGKAEVMEADVFYSSTYLVSTFEMAAALETLRQLQAGALERIWELGRRFSDGLTQLVAGSGVEARVLGIAPQPFLLFDSGDLERDLERKRVFYRSALDHGVFLHPNTHWFISSAHTPFLVDQTLAALERSLHAVQALD